MVPPQESYDQSLNLLFPWAEMDMKQWMNSSIAPPFLRGRDCVRHRKEFLFRSVQSLLSALAYIHREINGFTASHHDLKPANILIFDNQTWKICDFGKSGLRDLQDGSETEGRYGTRDSLVSVTGVSKVRNFGFGRAFDVWAMGCIIIELAIVLVYGWENGKLQKFTRKMTENGTPNDQ